MKTNIILGIVLLLGACTKPSSSNQNSYKAMSEKDQQKFLMQYTWSYTPANSQIPIELSFTQTGIGMYSQCNIISANYRLMNNTIVVEIPITSSAIGCPTHLEHQESLIKQFFEVPVAFKIIFTKTNQPLLILSQDQQQYTFLGKINGLNTVETN
ncbi:META domain-containing protein [Acinetobacter stercoris]|uniref:Uncharacterized protein n=1 Tax=Acinetobacter stercoris TaxID=2126983 RepID=A0A2U3N4T1_9GAMM|nr:MULTISPECIES: META domain-containing protein [Acinetobacter]SPL72663.1 hypothetical protein KPC_3841 [Acinetobacter stercoris]